MNQPAVTQKRGRLMTFRPARRTSRCSSSCHARLSGVGALEHHNAEIRLSGEIDIANCSHIPVDVEELCRSGVRLVRIDLAAVSFIDCTAVHAFVDARARAEVYGSDVVLTRVGGLPLRVLKLLELDALLLGDGCVDG
jgi:anti-anti-sigma factor